ncbi:MAG: hypothetical protein AAFN30_18160 [Actinomycetota bacterium]
MTLPSLDERITVNLDQATWMALALDAAMIAYTLAILVAGGLSRRWATVAGVVGAGWLVILWLLFANNAPFPDDISGVGFFAVVLVGVALVGGLLLGPPAVRQVLGRLDQTWLLAPQGIRVFFGTMFLLWAGEGILPRTFGIVDGFTHASAGFMGLAAAWVAAQANGSTVLPWIANVFGLVDILVVATSIAFVLLGDIGPHHPMMYAVFAPAPVWLWLHVVSIFRLVVPVGPAGGERADRRPEGPPALVGA